MRRNDGRSRLRRCANRRLRSVPLYSRPSALVAHAEAHLGRLRGDAETVEQPDEVRIRALVEDDEAGVDCVDAAEALDAMRVRVAAERSRRLRTPSRRARGRASAALTRPGDPGADDGDAHATPHHAAARAAPAARTAAAARQDELQVADVADGERRLAAGQVELPHADEAVVEPELAHLGALGEEALAPQPQRARVVRSDVAQRFDAQLRRRDFSER